MLVHENRARLYRERALECRLVAKEGWAAFRSNRFLELAERYERLAEIEEAHADAPLLRRHRLL